ncbi:MAG: COX15/CtaA family protein [Halobacteriaceae archaeon]
MRLRRLSALTTGMTFLLLLLGVYTKEVGADLTCGMRWPLCDGAVFGLFPANLASAIEWLHRFLALLVGLLVIWLAIRAYRELGGGSRIFRASLLALLLLPVQAGLGALTVVKYRVFTPETAAELSPLISTAHYGTGIALFTGLVAATLWARDRGPSVRQAATDPRSGTTGSDALE